MRIGILIQRLQEFDEWMDVHIGIGDISSHFPIEDIRREYINETTGYIEENNENNTFTECVLIFMDDEQK